MRPRALKLSLPLLAWAVLCLLVPAGASAQGVRPADQFVDSIGVNVHMTYRDTAYVDRPRLVNKLSEAGIRHVRDGLSWNTQYAYDTFNAMADRGIRTTFIMGDPSERRDKLTQLITALKTKVRRAAEAVEGPNEYSYSGDPQWAPNLKAYQSRLYKAVKSDASLAQLPMLAPSQITWQDHAAVGNIESMIDFGNKHSYPGGDIPESNVDNELKVAARMSGNRAVYVTESGYHNATATKSGHRPASEEAVGTYLPRMFLEYFRKGIPRTFSYELIDEWPDAAKKNSEANFGLLRNDYSEKPAFRSLSNLIALLSDRGGAHATTPLDHTISGAPSDLRKLVLQKRDGSHYLILWRAARVWDPVARAPVSAGSRSVTLRVPDPAYAGKQAEVFDPVASRTPVSKVTVDGSIPLALGARPLVIKLASSAPSAPAPVKRPVIKLTPAAPKKAIRAPRGRAVVRRAQRNPRSARVSFARRHRLAAVLRRGLSIRCFNPGGSCKLKVRYRGRVIAKGTAVTRSNGTTRRRLRLTRAGRRILRRALRRRRSLSARVVVSFGGGRGVTRRVGLRR